MPGHGPDDDRRSRVSDLFARMREAGPEAPRVEESRAETGRAPRAAAPKVEAQESPERPEQPATVLGEPGAVRPAAPLPTVAAGPEVERSDRVVRAARDAAVDAVLAGLVSGAKRRLQDEQNDVMDALRRQRTRIDPDAAVPATETQAAGWVEVIGRAVDEAYGAGRAVVGAAESRAPRGYVLELAASLVAPLRERVLATVASVARDAAQYRAPELLAELTSAVSARYREWRGQDLETLLGDLLAQSFARGAYDAAPAGVVLRWVPAELQECPDADDNALEPTVKGGFFPTGQACAPAHPGCRCVVVPATARP